MNLTLIRDQLSSKSSVGTLSIDGKFECFTLEDAVRPVKIKGLTAVPYGAYEVIISWSARFKRQLPLLLEVPHFDGIRIHAGNTETDTDGCILVGQSRTTDQIIKSRIAFSALFEKLEAASKSGKIFISIEAPSTAGMVGANTSSVTLAVPTKSLRRALTAITK
jgi:hypothetical protein